MNGSGIEQRRFAGVGGVVTLCLFLTACSKSAPPPESAAEAPAESAATPSDGGAAAEPSASSNDDAVGDPGLVSRSNSSVTAPVLTESRAEYPEPYFRAQTQTPTFDIGARLEMGPRPADEPLAASVFWNVWVESPCSMLTKIGQAIGLTQCPAGLAQPDSANKLVLTIGPEDIANEMSAVGSPAVQQALRDAQGATVRFAVIPILTGGDVELAEGQEKIAFLDVDRTRLVPKKPAASGSADAPTPPVADATNATSEPPTTSSDTNTAQSAVSANAKTTASNDLRAAIARAKATKAGQVELQLFVNRKTSGCVYVPLAIWDGQLRRPLDNLVIPITVGVSGEPSCSTETKKRVLSGVEAFASLDSGSESTADSAGIQVFEVLRPGELKARSFVVIAGHEDGEPYVYGWETDATVSTRISNSGALPEQIRLARKLMEDKRAPPEKRATAYADAAAFLRQSLFGVRDGNTDAKDAANRAYATLARLMERGKEPLPIVARFTTPAKAGGADLYYAPLRLLTAAGGDGFSKDFRAIQPLPIRRQLAGTCIDRWTIIGSEKLAEAATGWQAQQALNSMLKTEKPAWVRETITDGARLQSFFEGKDPAGNRPEETGNAEGVLLIAHHADYRGLFFDDYNSANKFDRKFRPGSVVVLAACATSTPGSADDMLKKLNRNNVDGIIASPFLVNASYATLMSHEIYKALDAAYSSGETPTLSRIFQRAIENTSRFNPGAAPELATYFQQEALEYVLAGEPDIQLCKRETAPHE